MSKQPNKDQHYHHKEAKAKRQRHRFTINDHIDILIEVLSRLDGRSLGVSTCVCRLWSSIGRNDSIWEKICFRHVYPPHSASLIRPTVVALGGYKRLYVICVRPVLTRLAHSGEVSRVIGTSHQVQLSLSLFCIDYYEKLGGQGGRFGSDASVSSLMFLRETVNV